MAVCLCIECGKVSMKKQRSEIRSFYDDHVLIQHNVLCTMETWSEEIGFSPEGTYEFPNEDGVYVIAQVLDDGTYNVRYVGQGNIYERMQAHKNFDTEQNECLAEIMSDTTNVKVRSVVASNEDERDNLEHTYYEHYRTQGHNLCNEISPHGKYLTGIFVPF